jgi:hypothetical protein
MVGHPHLTPCCRQLIVKRHPKSYADGGQRSSKHLPLVQGLIRPPASHYHRSTAGELAVRRRESRQWGHEF